jgi:hypothetical protein
MVGCALIKNLKRDNMRVIKNSLLLIACYIFVGCAKEEKINNTETQVGGSRVTFFATLNMTGNEIISVVKGSAFTDPGITATEGGKTIPVVTTGTVNTSAAGLYELTYTATNSDGFSSSSHRTVFVIPEAEKPGADLSGSYQTIGGNAALPLNTRVATISKVAPGVYYTTNCWGGGSSAVIPAYFICADGATVNLPLQNSVAGRIRSEGNGTYVNGLISWTITRLDFASGPLTVAKQWQKL